MAWQNRVNDDFLSEACSAPLSPCRCRVADATVANVSGMWSKYGWMMVFKLPLTVWHVSTPPMLRMGVLPNGTSILSGFIVISPMAEISTGPIFKMADPPARVAKRYTYECA